MSIQSVNPATGLVEREFEWHTAEEVGVATHQPRRRVRGCYTLSDGSADQLAFFFRYAQFVRLQFPYMISE